MVNLENVSADHLREGLSQIDDGDAAKRVTAALVFVEVFISLCVERERYAARIRRDRRD